MKRFLITSILAAIVAAGTTIMAQDQPDEYLGLPGDNLNLYAVMNLFQQSETLEGFERALNDENSRINNLDLNNDNYIDYVKVIDYVDKDAHTIVLQAVLDRNESQDVAVFTVQRFRDGSVQIQLIGDEALYGRNYIVEPIYAETPNPGYTGRSNRQNVNVVSTTYIEVAAWPLVRFIYLPNYSVWHSSWYWGYYPSYWHPWHPFYWHYYYGYHYHWYPYYYQHYRYWDNHRYSHWNDFYYNGRRTYSRNVSMRINEGNYRTTYSHPEQRRDGEALYAKANPDRPLRSSVSSSGNTNGRRSVSQSSSTKQSSGTSAAGTRRATSSTMNNSGSNRTIGKSSGNSRRAGSTVTNKSETNPSPGQYSGNSRRSSTSAVSGQSVSRPSSGQRTESARTSRQSNSSVISSGRRSSGSTKAAASSKESKKAKDSENSQTSRRK